MKVTEMDALLVLYLVLNGPSSSYQVAKAFLSAGLLREPERSGFKGVHRAVDSRLQRLCREGYLVKEGDRYSVTDRIILDVLTLRGEAFSDDFGPCLIFDTNGHYVIFILDTLLEPLDSRTVEQLFVGKPIYKTKTT